MALGCWTLIRKWKLGNGAADEKRGEWSWMIGYLDRNLVLVGSVVPMYVSY